MPTQEPPFAKGRLGTFWLKHQNLGPPFFGRKGLQKMAPPFFLLIYAQEIEYFPYPPELS